MGGDSDGFVSGMARSQETCEVGLSRLGACVISPSRASECCPRRHHPPAVRPSFQYHHTPRGFHVETTRSGSAPRDAGRRPSRPAAPLAA
jgi:hypothetical protein